ncbi:penicillin-binding transpeptidase domain-containing protein [Luteimicrobium sp. NPDC057192]|uniref:penicillin-binding transpeptidase domain-containing protein n=1 Tax=Luteimicrobium sp. NPDC057192 TaxID=3346042 RepID=UPI00363E1B05
MPEPTSTRATVRAVRRRQRDESGRRRGGPALLAVTGLVLVGSLAGCTHKPDDTPLQDAAAQLASSLAGGSLDGVALTGAAPAEATAERKDVFAAVPVRPTVTVKDVARVKDHDDQATATLAWTWPVAAGHPWSYTTTVHLDQGAKDATSTATGTATAAPSAGDDAWSVRWDPTVLLPDLADDQHVTFSRVRPQRANIVDGSGKAIVEDRAVNVIGVDKTRTDEAKWESSARSLAKALDLDADAYAKQVAAAGPKAFVEAIALRASDPTDVSKLTAIPGVVALAQKMPLAPTHDWARPLLGTVGDATAEIVKASGGRVQSGDQTGLSGIQKQYDAQLAGQAGIAIRLVDDGDGGLSSGGDGSDDKGTELFSVAVVDGTPVKLTLDSALQSDAEKVLADQKVAAAIVAVSTSGKVLAAASASAGGGLSTATTGKFAPGSTMKVASSLALLREGAKATTTVPCTPSLTVDGRKFTNDADYPPGRLGDIALKTAFANSCNTAFISQAKKIDQQELHDAAADLGIGVPSALGVPAFFGSVPTTGGGATDHAASMIGQGRVEASPLTMATVAATVAAGHRVSPVLVEPAKSAATEAGAATASPTDVATLSPTAAPSKLTKSEASTLHGFMRAVVTEGTGTILSSLPGDVAAKTGTAQFGDGGKAHAWMIAADGDVGVAVFVDEGEYGATTAGPLLKEFLQDLAQDHPSK